MNTQTRFIKFKKVYDEALACIEQYRSNDSEPEMQALTKWLLETDRNSYGFLIRNGGALSSAESFSSLLNYIHHAIYDDGDITFATVNGEPRIVFSEYDDDFRDHALSEIELEYDNNATGSYEIKKLKDGFEFINTFDTYDKARARRNFEYDILTIGIDSAIEKHKDHKNFCAEWIQKAVLENNFPNM